MKSLRLVPIAALCFLSLPAFATEVGVSRNFGLGVQVGNPTAIVGKAFLGGGDAFDFGLGFAGCRNEDGRFYNCDQGSRYVSVHADYLYEEPFITHPFRLDGHAGFGGRFINWNNRDGSDSVLLARVPLGLDFTFRRPSWLEAFIEIAPALLIVPGVDIWFDVGLGARAYF